MFASIAQQVERFVANEKVVGSYPITRFLKQYVAMVKLGSRYPCTVEFSDRTRIATFMSDNTKKLQVLSLRLDADLMEATSDFESNPNMETLNTLVEAKNRRELFQQVVNTNETNDNTSIRQNS